MSCIEFKDIAQYEEADSELAKNTIAKLEKENKAYKNLVNELQKVISGELMPKCYVTNGKANEYFNEGWSLLKDFIEDRINKFIGSDKNE